MCCANFDEAVQTQVGKSLLQYVAACVAVCVAACVAVCDAV